MGGGSAVLRALVETGPPSGLTERKVIKGTRGTQARDGSHVDETQAAEEGACRLTSLSVESLGKPSSLWERGERFGEVQGLERLRERATGRRKR